MGHGQSYDLNWSGGMMPTTQAAYNPEWATAPGQTFDAAKAACTADPLCSAFMFLTPEQIATRETGCPHLTAGLANSTYPMTVTNSDTIYGHPRSSSTGPTVWIKPGFNLQSVCNLPPNQQ